MCSNCGCDTETHITLANLQTGEQTIVARHRNHHDHVHARQRDHRDHAHHDRTHSHDPDAQVHVVKIETKILAKNNALAQSNRIWLAERGLLALNLMSAPGAGKTTLLERTIRDIKSEIPLYVLEGDQATANDAKRIQACGAPVVQVNTGAGCHLEAEMVARGLNELAPAFNAVVIIENVGNLVCPALFDLGEHRRVAILSVTEGDDKPIKYPHMFRAADLLLLNKVDLLPYVDFNMDRACDRARTVNPDIDILALSARTGEGMGSWYTWLRGQRALLPVLKATAMQSREDNC